MTSAFEKFMKQYKMTGSEKADGYSRDVFIGLNEHEEEEVFVLLTTELPWSAEWLFFLNPAKAAVVAKDLEKKMRGDPYKDTYMLQRQLIKYTGELDYQTHMIEDYPNYPDSSRPYVVDAVDGTPINQAQLDFFKQVILVEVNSTAVARASRHLLDAKKFPRISEIDKKKYDRILNELRSDSVQVKKRAIAEIDKYQATYT
jgi:hypothetical protein